MSPAKRNARKNTEHVRMKDNPMGFLCEHCGDQYFVSVPIAFDMLASLSKTFLKKHRDCPKPAKVSHDHARLKRLEEIRARGKPSWADTELALEQARFDLGHDGPSVALLNRAIELLGGKRS